MNHLLRAVLLLSCLLAACNVRLAGSDTTIIVEGFVRSNGQPVGGATVSAFSSSVLSSMTGDFLLRVKADKDRVPVEVNAKGYAPAVALLTRRDGVVHYTLDVELTPPQRMVTKSDMTQQITLTAGDQTITVEVPPDAIPAGATLELTMVPAENGPGAMETTEAADSLLQTGGMLYLRAVDAQGNEVELGGQGVAVVMPGMMSDIGPTGPTQAYALGADAVWAPTPAPAGSSTGSGLRFQRRGWSNVDRSFRTTCLRGKLNAPTKSCGGQRVRAGGRQATGLYSQDTAAADGTFCLEAPAGLQRTLMVGSTNKFITFGSFSGSCRTGAGSCMNIGEVAVADTDCPKSCAKGLVDTVDGCKVMDEPMNGGTGGGGGSSNVGCGPPSFGGCSALGSGITNARLGNGCCSYSTCERGGDLGSCTDGCGAGWYEAQGRIFGPCETATGTCIQNAATAAVNACKK